jgi:hypothetical protein
MSLFDARQHPLKEGALSAEFAKEMQRFCRQSK